MSALRSCLVPLGLVLLASLCLLVPEAVHRVRGRLAARRLRARPVELTVIRGGRS